MDGKVPDPTASFDPALIPIYRYEDWTCEELL